MPPIVNIRRIVCFALICLISSNAAAQLSANFTPDVNSGCLPLVVHFQDQSSGNPNQWSWSLGNGVTSQQQNPTTTYFIPGIYNVKLVIRNNNAVDSVVKQQIIIVRSNPLTAFSVSDSAGCFPKTIQFTDKTLAGSGNMIQWSWDLGDGNVSATQNPVHTYSQPGSYSVTLKVINSYGCEKTITRTNLIALTTTKAGFSAVNTSGCEMPSKISFSNTSSAAISYQWDFGDGTQSVAADPIHSFTATGVYNIRLIAISSSGCTDTIQKQITVGKATANFTVASPTCAKTQMNFQNASSATPVSAVWVFGDGTISADINPAKVFTTAGTYQVKLISNFGSCSDTIIKAVIVHPIPTASFNATGDLVKCSPAAAVTFNNSSSGGINYAWDFGDGNISSATNISHTYISNGKFDVSLVAINPFGCKDSVVKQALIKIFPPKITGFSGVPYMGCTPYTAHLTAQIDSPEPVTSWKWSFGDGSTSNSLSPSHTYSLPGIFDVTLIITTSGGCTDTFIYTAAVAISDKPVANFTTTPNIYCGKEKVKFTNLSSGATEWLWMFGDDGVSIDKEPNKAFGDTGVFTIKLIAISSTGCRDTMIKPDYVKILAPIGRYNIVRNCDDPYKIRFRDSSSGGNIYKWNFGDGDSSSLRYPIHTYKAPGTYAFKFNVIEGACDYPLYGTIQIVDEHPIFSLTDTIFCKSTPAVFTASNVNQSNITNYNWQFGDGIISNSASSSIQHSYGTTGAYKPTLIATDILGCTDTVTSPLTVKIFGPVAKFKNVEGTCINSLISFTDSSATDGIHPIQKWQWNYGDGSVINGISVAHTYATKGIFDVLLKVKDSYGCEDSLLKPAAVIISDPVAGFYSSDSIKCSLNAISLNNNSDGLNLSYSWRFGDGNNSNEFQPIHTYNSNGLYTIQLIVTDRFGCKDTVVKQQVISDPTAFFSASDTFSTCPPLVVNLTNKSGNYTKSAWSFGDGSSSANADPSHYYTTPGIFQLKLHINGYGSCKDSVVKTIVLKGPSGSFQFNPSTVCANTPVQFNAITKNNSRFLWDFSDGLTAATPDSMVSHSYDLPGFYQPKLILIDSAGCQVPIVSPDTIKVLGVKARIGLSKSLFCDSTTTQFFDSSLIVNDSPMKYSWNFGDGSISTNKDPWHNYKTPGQYDVRLIVETQSGCKDSTKLSTPILIAKSPKIVFTSRASVCLGVTINLKGILSPDTSAVKWRWYLGNRYFSSNQNPSMLPDSAGDSKITAMVINSSGCSDTAINMILVHPLPNLNAGTDTMICLGQTYTLQPLGAATYTWQNDAVLNCITCSNPVITPKISNTYFVKGSSEFGCEAVDSVTISVMQPFEMKVSNSDTLCAGDKLQLIANGAAKYNWYPSIGLNSSMISNPVASPTATTNYMVIGRDVKNCFSDTAYVRLSVFPVPQFNITDNIIQLPAGETSAIRTTGSEDITHWKWYPSKDINCTDCPQPIVTAKDNMVYKAEVWNDGGCTSTDKVSISVICNDGNVFIPNTFSPNNDGMNDVFYVKGKGINSVKSMKVFNRWGEPVFEKNDFNANDINTGWNGIYKNLKLTPDVYVYIVDVVCSNNTVFTLKGNVTLIR